MKIHKSEISYSFYSIAVVIAIAIILSFVFTMKGVDSISETIVLFVAYIMAALAFYFSVVHPLINTQYVIEGGKMVIRSGFYKKTISLNQVIEIIEKKSFGREPALSSRRLYIKYRDGQDMYCIGISPKDRVNFLKDIGNSSSS